MNMHLCSQKLPGNLFHIKILQQYPEAPINSICFKQMVKKRHSQFVHNNLHCHFYICASDVAWHMLYLLRVSCVTMVSEWIMLVCETS
jgi:hypothetical protein